MSTKTQSHGPSSRGRKRPTPKALLIAAAVSGALAVPVFLSPVLSASPPLPASAFVKKIAVDRASFADVIERVKPAVVNISTRGAAGSAPARPDLDLPPGSSFDEFLRRFFEQRPGGATPRPDVLGQGSGFVIDPAGYVVTNNHVVDGADAITVTFNDGTEYPAEVEGRDPKTDLALLKIEAKRPLPHVAFGDSDAARVGDWVIAIGNPFGLGGTATTGIISARGRDIQAGPFDDFIQIDAPINRGNSGGPVFDRSGRVIGVNTAIYSPTGGNVGIGFAIPSTQVETVVAALRTHGQVDRGWLGVQIQPVTPDVAASLGLDKPKGALVADVVADSAAARAGIRSGDVITEFAGRPVGRVKDLTRLVAGAKADEAVDIGVWRQGKGLHLQAIIGATPASEKVAAKDAGPRPAGQLGLALAPVSAETRQRFDLPDDVSGVLVVGVREGSPAARKGLREGDVISMVGQTAVSTPAAVIEAVEQARTADRDVVLLRVARGKAQRFVTLDIA